MKVSELMAKLTEITKDGADPEVRIVDNWDDVLYIREVRHTLHKQEAVLIQTGSFDGSLQEDDVWTR